MTLVLTKPYLQQSSQIQFSHSILQPLFFYVSVALKVSSSIHFHNSLSRYLKNENVVLLCHSYKIKKYHFF